MKFAVLGAGTFGARHLQAYDRNPEAELAGIDDLDRQRAERIAATCAPPVPVFDDLNEMLSIVGSQAVSIVTHQHIARAVHAAGPRRRATGVTPHPTD